MKLTHIGYPEPKLGDDLMFLFNKWDDKNAYLLDKEGRIWLSFETSRNEKLGILQALMKKWLG